MTRLFCLAARRILVFTLLLFGLALHAQTTGPKLYSYPAEGFRASFPSQPTLSTQKVNTADGNIEIRSYLADLGRVVPMVTVCDYSDKVRGSNPDSILEGAQKGLLKSAGVRLLSSEKVTFGTSHGLKFEAENYKIHVSARYYFVGTTLYQTMVFSELSAKPHATAKKFLDSFELIPRVRS